MIEKKGNSHESNSSEQQQHEEKDAEISKLKLLYRKIPNSERNKSSGVSSDEETTSSSLVPISATLKQIRNKSKWTANDTAEHCGLEATYGYGVNDKSSGNIMNSLEEIRKKYTLQNERSVALKMDSANMMLDDILNTSNLRKSSTANLTSKSHKDQELKRKTIPENESSFTENSDSLPPPCGHILNYSHVPVAVDFLASQCHKHCNSFQPFHASSSSLDKGATIPIENLALVQRKRSFAEKFQDLQIGGRVQSVYKLLQKTKNPFARNSKVAGNISVYQGIPGPGYENNVLIQNEILAYNCEHNQCSLNHYPKRMMHSYEVSETSSSSSQSKNSERDDMRCTCVKQKVCNCPEVIPTCVCVESTCKVRKLNCGSPTQDFIHPGSIDYNQATQSASPMNLKKENESALVLDKDQEGRKTQPSSQGNDSKGWRKVSSEKKEIIQRTDIYFFDHGNSAYYKTTDDHPKRITEDIVERTDECATKFWAEIFGTFEIGVAFIISFIIQLYRFLFTSIIRPILVGIIQVSSDYFFKPLLTIIFNGIIQPVLILAFNIATSIRDLCLPISQTFGFFAKVVAKIFNSCRLIEVKYERQSSSHSRNKV